MLWSHRKPSFVIWDEYLNPPLEENGPVRAFSWALFPYITEASNLEESRFHAAQKPSPFINALNV